MQAQPTYDLTKICELVDNSQMAGVGVKSRLFEGTDDLKGRLDKDLSLIHI